MSIAPVRQLARPSTIGVEVDPEAANATLATIPLGRIGDPERDIGRAVVFLVGPDAGYVTALTMPLDGGQAYFG